MTWWRANRGNKRPQWQTQLQRVKRRLPVILWIFVKLRSVQKLSANWNQILSWNTNSCESRSLHVMDIDYIWTDETQLWVFDYTSLVYLFQYSISFKEGTSIDHLLMEGTCVSHDLWASQFTCELCMLIIFRWVTCSLGKRLPALQEGWHWSPASASRAMALCKPHPTRWWKNQNIRWPPKPRSHWFWPWPAP